jgi:hypothetical protein
MRKPIKDALAELTVKVAELCALVKKLAAERDAAIAERNANSVAMAQAVCRADRDTASAREAWEAVGAERRRAETAEAALKNIERRLIDPVGLDTLEGHAAWCYRVEYHESGRCCCGAADDEDDTPGGQE